MHCDMLKIQDGVAIVEKLNYTSQEGIEPNHLSPFSTIRRICSRDAKRKQEFSNVIGWRKSSLLRQPITLPDSCFRFASREQIRLVENGLYTNNTRPWTLHTTMTGAESSYVFHFIDLFLPRSRKNLKSAHAHIPGRNRSLPLRLVHSALTTVSIAEVFHFFLLIYAFPSVWKEARSTHRTAKGRQTADSEHLDERHFVLTTAPP